MAFACSWILLILFYCMLILGPCACQLQQDTSRSAVKGDGTVEVEGEESDSAISTFRRLNLVCDKVAEHFGDMTDNTELNAVYRDFGKDLESRDGDFYYHKKLVPNPHGSICPHLNVTCCKPAMEKASETLALNEYKFYYDEFFRSHSKTCLSPVKRLHTSSQYIIGELIQELEVHANQTLDGMLPSDTFKNLSNFLTSFSGFPDICPLPQIMEAQVHSLVEITLRSIFGDDETGTHILDDPELMTCMVNVSLPLIDENRRELMLSLERQLQDLGMLSISLRMAQEVIETIRHYTLSQSCVKAITHMKYCQMCGGYGDFRPCLFMCINTLRGCFADLAEIHSDFSGMISSLRTLSEGLVQQLTPNIFSDSYLYRFVLILKDIKKNEDNLRDAISRECYFDSQNEVSSIRTKRSGSILQPIQGPKDSPKQDPILEQLNLKVLETVFEAELSCLERVAVKMNEVPDDICFLGKYSIAHNGNSQCWTGSTLGRYEHPKAGLLKKDQLKNPVYSDLPMTTEVRYAKLIAQIRDTTKNVNATIAFNRLCLQSDDEDCYRNSFQHCSSGSGSRSGSGSGSRSESGSGSGSGSEPNSGVTETSTESEHTESVFTTTETFIATTHTKVFDNRLNDEIGTTTQKPPSTANPFTLKSVTIQSDDGENFTQRITDNNIPVDGKIPKPPPRRNEPPEVVVVVNEKTTATADGALTTTQSSPDGEETTLSSGIIAASDEVETAHTINQPLTDDITDANTQRFKEIPTISSAASFYAAEILTCTLITCTLITCLASTLSL